MANHYFVVETESIENYWACHSVLSPLATQLAKGRFFGKIEGLDHPDITIARRIATLCTRESGFLAGGHFAFNLYNGDTPVFAAGVPYVSGDITGLLGGNPYQFIATSNCRFFTLRVSRVVCEQFLHPTMLIQVEKILSSGLPTKLRGGDSLHPMIDFINASIDARADHLAANEGELEKRNGSFAEFQSNFFELMGQLIDSSTLITERLNSRSHLFQKALEAINNTPLEGLCLTRLSHSLGTSRRNLEMVFSERLGITPKEFINNLRLNETRRRLLNARGSHSTIAQIALECGINHMGNFARNYAAMFNELPSETLEKSQLHSV